MEKSEARLGLFLALMLAPATALGGCGDDDGGVDGGTDSAVDGGLDSGAGDADVDGGSDAASDAGDDAGTDTGTPPPTCDETTLAHLAVVTTAADYSGSAFTSMLIADHTAPAPTDLMDSDAVAAQSGCQGYVLERGRGMADVIDPAAPPAITRTVDLNPAGTPAPYTINPQAVAAVGPSRAYVVEAARNSVTIMNPNADGAAAVVGTIDLSPYLKAGDMDGLVDAADAIVVGDRAYVALGNYWFDSSFAIHFEGSELAV
ncbi:MAG: hypothetical protein JRH11_08005, partial [Deltaproteobacteria bacterium]|nr:hypothetical protein [Deltaproteobacteria bacterium]